MVCVIYNDAKMTRGLDRSQKNGGHGCTDTSNHLDAWQKIRSVRIQKAKSGLHLEQRRPDAMRETPARPCERGTQKRSDSRSDAVDTGPKGMEKKKLKLKKEGGA